MKFQKMSETFFELDTWLGEKNKVKVDAKGRLLS